MNDAIFNDSQESKPTFRSFRDAKQLAWGPGTEFDGFRLLGKVGRGGLGEVWKARDLEGNRDVALKFVPRDIQNHEDEMQRVNETFQTVHQLHHQHICPMHALRRHDDFGAYLMMDFIDGISLSLYLRHEKKLTLSRTLEILRPLAAALDHAHSKKVIHRDIKPGNTMLVFEKNADGTWDLEKLRDVQLIDFGLASEFRQSLTRVSQVRMGTSGTMPYMSPEQFRGEYQDAYSDQYSLAVMTYEMLSGHLPFCADDPMILMNCISSIPPLPLDDQPQTVNSALLRALAKTRKDRFSTCTEFADALTSQTVRPKPAPETSNPFADIFKTAEQKREEERKRAEKELSEKKKQLEDSAKKAYADEDLPLAKMCIDELLALDPENPHYLQFRDFIQIQFDSLQLDSLQLDPAPPTRQAGERMVKTVDGIEYAFRWVPQGTFMMGSPKDAPNRFGDETQHKVTLTRGFWMLETPVTQAMWQSAAGTDPSEFKGAQNPVECVSWNDCQEFCRKLSSKLSGSVSLPTEAQWEYACRAGTTTAYSFGNSLNGTDANCNGYQPYGTAANGPYLEKTAPVKSYAPNGWGLYDMHGNVREWCSDCYGPYAKSPVSDPTGPENGPGQVNRGGSWNGSAGGCRSAYRNYYEPDFQSVGLGLRVVLEESDQ